MRNKLIRQCQNGSKRFYVGFNGKGLLMRKTAIENQKSGAGSIHF